MLSWNGSVIWCVWRRIRITADRSIPRLSLFTSGKRGQGLTRKSETCWAVISLRSTVDEDFFFIGDRLSRCLNRGGNWNNGADNGVFYGNLNNERSNSNTNRGGRSASLLLIRFGWVILRLKSGPCPTGYGRCAGQKEPVNRSCLLGETGKNVNCCGGGNVTHSGNGKI